MISVDHGMVKTNGTIIELCADVGCAYNALLDTMPDDDDTKKDLSTHMIKALFFDMASSTAKKGFDIHYTAEEVADFEKIWGATKK